MKLSKHFNRHTFLKEYWQTKPLLTKGAFTFSGPMLSGEELAGLACEEFVESRLIHVNENQNQWDCEFGHFSEQHFSTLDNRNWTLLVQNVDDFVPEAKALSQAFDFLPKWRLDDVMFSYATPGGGVGPHFDYYDVFLIQTSGSREWLIGQDCNSDSVLRKHADMKLLENFEQKEKYILNPGDMIYIPAGVAHWGTALSEDCISASIGFRAPAHSELLAASLSSLAEKFTAEQRYKDTEIADDKYLIANSIKTQLSEIYANLSEEEFIEALTHQFALQVTEIRHPELMETLDDHLQDIDIDSIQQNASSRFAYRLHTEIAILYVNGESYSTDLQSAQAICKSEFKLVNDKSLLSDLISKGALITD